MLKCHHARPFNPHAGAKRVGFLGIVTCVAAMVAALCSSSAVAAPRATETVNVVSIANSLYMVQIYAAQAAGIFRKHGLKVNLINVNTSGGLTTTAALTRGDADLNLSGPTVIVQAVQGGINLGYACGTRSVTDNAIVIPKESDIPISGKGSDGTATLKALRGKKLGIAGIGSFNQLTFIAALKVAGVNPDEVTWVTVGGSASAVAALRSGQVDAVMGYGGLTELATSTVGAKVALQLSRVKGMGGVQYNGWIVDNDRASANPRKINAFCASMSDVYKYLKTKRGMALGINVLRKKVGVSVAVARAFMQNTARYLYPYLSSARMSNTVKFLKSIGQASPTFTNPLVWTGSKYLRP